MSACPSRFTLVTLVTLVALVASLASVSAEVTWHDSWDKARNEAQASGRPILIDFTAAWCYSCYYMEKNVLDEPAFHQAAEKFIMLKMDVDRPQGRDLRERYGARFLPSYILVNRDGREIGRVVGEQTEHDFIRQIEGLLGQKSHDPVEEAVGNLKNHLSAGRLNQAKKEIASMPAGQKKFLNQSLEWRLLKARLDLKTAKKTERAQGVRPLRFLLENEAGCDLAYDISNGNELLENLAPQISRPVYESEKEALQKLTDKRFFITGDDRCADWRTGIEILADVYDRLGLNAEKSHLLERAVKYLDDQKLPPGQDRNHDDNLRFFLELAGYDSRLRLFYPQLITAWPSDYVYPYRFAKYLLGKNKPEPALALISQAARLCYGANCLAVAKIQAEALAVMGRSQEAVAFLSKTIKDNKKVFPKETEVLETLYKKLK